MGDFLHGNSFRDICGHTNHDTGLVIWKQKPHDGGCLLMTVSVKFVFPNFSEEIFFCKTKEACTCIYLIN